MTKTKFMRRAARESVTLVLVTATPAWVGCGSESGRRERPPSHDRARHPDQGRRLAAAEKAQLMGARNGLALDDHPSMANRSALIPRDTAFGGRAAA
jgi:hypothetical protein